ncbi:MAG: hypothetical protein HOC20_10355 [Chloroflexi bacterium]|jgi:hypothetical protein|nr:hypothetical protein [Chloroflexota bacterium]
MKKFARTAVTVLIILQLLLLGCGDETKFGNPAPGDYQLDTYAIAEELTVNAVTMRIEQVSYGSAFSVQRGYISEQWVGTERTMRKERVRIDGIITNDTAQWVRAYQTGGSKTNYSSLYTLSAGKDELHPLWFSIPEAEFHWQEEGNDGFLAIPPGSRLPFAIVAEGNLKEGSQVRLNVEKIGFATGPTWSYSLEFVLPEAVQVPFDPFTIKW